MFLTTSGAHNFAYGSLILLQLPLHLFTLILKGYNEGSLLFISIIFVLILHSLLLIEANFKEFTFNGLQLKKIVVKNSFLINPNILYYAIIFH